MKGNAIDSAEKKASMKCSYVVVVKAIAFYYTFTVMYAWKPEVDIRQVNYIIYSLFWRIGIKDSNVRHMLWEEYNFFKSVSFHKKPPTCLFKVIMFLLHNFFFFSGTIFSLNPFYEMWINTSVRVANFQRTFLPRKQPRMNTWSLKCVLACWR